MSKTNSKPNDHQPQGREPLSSPLRVAMIGTGYFSQFHLQAWQRMADVSVVGLTSLDMSQARALAQTFNIDAVYDNVRDLLEQSHADVIDIVAPPSAHATLIRQSLTLHKTVICQKPFCASVEEARETIKHIKAVGGRVIVHENFRFQPWYQAIKNVIDSRQLGDIYEVNFDFRPGDGQGNNAYLERQPYFQTQPRFLIQETGVHFIDVFRYLFGDIKGLFARLQKLNPVIAGEDAGVVIMEFTSGVRGVFNANRLSDHATQNPRLTMGEMRIEGSNGTLTLDGDGRLYFRKHGSNEVQQHHYGWPIDKERGLNDESDQTQVGFGGDCVFNTNRHIANHLLYGNALYNDAESYLVNREIEHAIYESSSKQCWITL